MTSTISHLSRPEPHRLEPLTLVAIALVGAALTAVVWGLAARPSLSVDGTTRSVSPAETIADLADAGFTQGRVGTIYTVHGGIASLHGGGPVAFLRNGRRVSDSQRVYAGDQIVTVSGADFTERVISTRISVDPTATIQGSGPILRLVSPGRPGVAIVRKGAISGEIVSTKVITPAVNIVLQASAPSSADKLVALTFDDGPWPGSTLKIIEILKSAGVPATFFEIGEQVARTPALTKAVAAAGFVVGNHSWSHPFLTKMKPAEIRKQITDTATAIKRASGVAPTVFRPPYGAINHNVWVQAKATHETVTLWNVDALDWTRPGPAKIVENVTREMGQASIVLMHDGGGDRSQTIAALPDVIAWLKAHGYTFVTVPELQAIR